MGFEYRVHATPEELFSGLAELVTRVASGAGAVVLLGGGRTGSLLNTAIRERRPQGLERTVWGVTDERLVAVDDERSNQGALLRELIRPLGLSRALVVPDIGRGPRHACEDFSRRVARLSGISLTVAGCGEDGHTASLFPGREALEQDSAAVLGGRGPEGLERVSLGFPTLRRSRILLVPVTGARKGAVWREIRDGRGEAYPVARLGQGRETQVWLDEAAAKAAGI